MAGDVELVGLLVAEVVDLVACAVHDHRALGAVDGDAAVAVVGLLAVAAVALPGDELVGIGEGDVEGVVELPVVLGGVASAGGGDVVGYSAPRAQRATSISCEPLLRVSPVPQTLNQCQL